jgi:hypothetical protein
VERRYFNLTIRMPEYSFIEFKGHTATGVALHCIIKLKNFYENRRRAELELKQKAGCEIRRLARSKGYIEDYLELISPEEVVELGEPIGFEPLLIYGEAVYIYDPGKRSGTASH